MIPSSPVSDVIEILTSYFFLLLPWPSAFVLWCREMDAWVLLVAWLVVGAFVVWRVARRKSRRALFAWIAFWFMPGTVICGSATLVPWPLALIMAFGESGCSSALSLGTTAALNFAIVFGATTLMRRCGRRRDTTRPGDRRDTQ